jgi:hypothetical protein
VNGDDIKRLVDQFIAFVDSGAAESGDPHRELLGLLDSLALAEASLPLRWDNRDYPDPPREDARALRKRVEEAFPDYGYYNQVGDLRERIADTELMVGDAIDDIVDIYGDLREVQWRWENNSPDDGLWSFKHDYGFHWGWHLRDLQRYVHDVVFRSDGDEALGETTGSV